MDQFLKNKKVIAAGLLVIAVLVGAFFMGGSPPKQDATGDKLPAIVVEDGEDLENSSEDVEDLEELENAGEDPDDADATSSASEKYSEEKGMEIDPETGKDKYQTDPVPEGKPLPVEPQDKSLTGKTLTATLSIRCDAILDHMDLLDKEKWELVPEDGVIFAAKAVSFKEGESVFDLLNREMKGAKIHMEFVDTPMYNSVYIEGINNLYEFDVGALSGWMYKVNGWFPNYGASRYQLENGDIVEWVYTCDLGRDVGGEYSAGGS